MKTTPLVQLGMLSQALPPLPPAIFQHERNDTRPRARKEIH